MKFSKELILQIAFGVVSAIAGIVTAIVTDAKEDKRIEDKVNKALAKRKD